MSVTHLVVEFERAQRGLAGLRDYGLRPALAVFGSQE
jgi:hypothetical protein